MNLGINASNAMPEGGHLIFETRNMRLHQDDPLIHHLKDREGAYVLLSVADTGHGMDTETHRRIFEPFFTTREIGQGSGLGLAMVYGIIKNHDGHILCASQPGQGTRFDIYLPAIPAPQTAAIERKSMNPDLPVGNETILLVDDEPAILDLAETLLGRFGYQVLRAEDGEQALAVMARQKQPVDLVILDLNMPGMGGHGCLEALQADYPQVPVLVASGYSSNGSGHDTLAAGAVGFIGKPYQLKEMLRVVRKVIDTGTT
jgi:CheY-like chemotaxis protein